MAERLRETGEVALITEREVLEGLSRLDLRALKVSALQGISERERVVHLVNDILDNGYAYEANITGLYDANDGTMGSPEHPEDSTWPKGVILGEN